MNAFNVEAVCLDGRVLSLPGIDEINCLRKHYIGTKKSQILVVRLVLKIETIQRLTSHIARLL